MLFVGITVLWPVCDVSFNFFLSLCVCVCMEYAFSAVVDISSSLQNTNFFSPFFQDFHIQRGLQCIL